MITYLIFFKLQTSVENDIYTFMPKKTKKNRSSAPALGLSCLGLMAIFTTNLGQAALHLISSIVL